MLEIIGAGFGRTGTHSLAAALETLGFGPCYHMLELGRNPHHAQVWKEAIDGQSVDWWAFFRSYQSTVEWPAVAFLDHILPAFPEARVILTQRHPDDWYESAWATIFDGLEMSRYNPDPDHRELAGLARRLILDHVFAGRYGEKEYALQVYRQHIQQVRKLVPPERLLSFHVRQGWGPLCQFLGLPEPAVDFPWMHERSAFMAREPEWAKAIKSRRARGLDDPMEPDA